MTIEILCSKNQICTVDEIDADLAQYKWSVLKNHSGFYAVGGDSKHRHYMHRLILERKVGRKLNRNELTDHIDGNTLNNSRSNLRVATFTENLMNSKRPSSNKSGYKGVCWNKYNKKWQVQITIHGKKTFIGYFSDVIEASKAYNQAAKKAFGEFARIE